MINIVIFILIGINLVVTLCIIKVLLNFEKRMVDLDTLAAEHVSNVLATPKNSIENDVASGLIKGLTKMRSDDERHLQLMEMSRKLQRTPMAVMNHNSASDEIINTGGDLIPANLTKEELEVLKLYYEK